VNSDDGQHSPTIDESGNVDKIRSILFGSQMREYDGRFQSLEERLVREAGELRGDVQKRLEALESFIKGEVESMMHRLRGEHDERCQAIERAGRDLAETARTFEQKIGQLDEHTSKDVRDLHQQLLEQSKALGADIKDRHEQMKNGLESEAQKLRQAMTSRESLGDLFSELSLRLKNEFHVPGA
jgi:hypothetical protein